MTRSLVAKQAIITNEEIKIERYKIRFYTRSVLNDIHDKMQTSVFTTF